MRVRLRTYLITGLLVILPLAVTLLLLRFLFTELDNVLQPVVRRLLGRTITGLGFIAGFALILLAGAVASNVLGRRVINRFERLMLRIPLARTIYGSIKQFSEGMLLPDGRGAFQRVVLVQWPRPGLYAMGFVTGGDLRGTASGLLHVFIPGTPNPTAGFVVIVSEREVQPVDLTVEEALKFIMSGGITGTPDQVLRTLAARAEGIAGRVQ